MGSRGLSGLLDCGLVYSLLGARQKSLRSIRVVGSVSPKYTGVSVSVRSCAPSGGSYKGILGVGAIRRAAPTVYNVSVLLICYMCSVLFARFSERDFVFKTDYFLF